MGTISLRYQIFCFTSYLRGILYDGIRSKNPMTCAASSVVFTFTVIMVPAFMPLSGTTLNARIFFAIGADTQPEIKNAAKKRAGKVNLYFNFFPGLEFFAQFKPRVNITGGAFRVADHFKAYIARSEKKHDNQHGQLEIGKKALIREKIIY